MALLIKNLPTNSGGHKRCRFDPCVRKIPWKRAWQSSPVFLLGNLMERGAWWAIGMQKLDMTKATQYAYFSQIRLQNKKAAVYTTVLFSGKPVMIVTEYMENGSLDTFLKVRFYINATIESVIYILTVMLKEKQKQNISI